MLDAMQSTRPFYADLFKVILKVYHIEFSKFMKEYWNLRMKEFDVFNINARE
jgi:hypothetical protein